MRASACAVAGPGGRWVEDAHAMEVVGMGMRQGREKANIGILDELRLGQAGGVGQARLRDAQASGARLASVAWLVAVVR